jgi:hypothetical protein
VSALIGAGLLVGMVGAGAQAGEAVAVGDGSVLVGQVGTRDILALDDAARATAASALLGMSIGIVLVPGFMGETIDESVPEAQGAEAAIEALGARAAVCDRVEFKRRQARCGRTAIDAAVVLQFFPSERFAAPERLIRQGFPVVAIDTVAQEAPTDGSVWLRVDHTAAGLEEGRAAGAWAASAWPDTDVTVAIQPIAAPPDPFFDAVSQGILESLPTATVLPQPSEPIESIDANLYTGGISGRLVAGLLEATDLGIDGAPLAVFSITCPDPLPTDERFAGCLNLGYEDVGAAAVDVVARLITGGEVPAEVAVGPTIEVVLAG